MSKRFDSFTNAYIQCMLWCETDQTNDQGGEPLENNYNIDDFVKETLDKIEADCVKFQTDHWDMICGDLERAGHDFWLTRNGHSAGFWDGDWPEYGDKLTVAAKRFRSLDVYVGDDDKLYFH